MSKKLRFPGVGGLAFSSSAFSLKTFLCCVVLVGDCGADSIALERIGSLNAASLEVFEFCDCRMKSALMDFVGDAGDGVIIGDCLAEGEVFIRSGGELLMSRDKYGLERTEGEY
jgi:hypothetical protein